jgi:hypothetical protein
MLVILSISVGLAHPQKDHKSWFKVLGRVIDGSGHPIKCGRVYIKDSHAHILKIRSVGRDGRFNIAWLDARLDYEISAEQDDLVSEKVLLSGSQSAAEVVITLKLRNE